MSEPPAFERILASLYDAMFDDARWPAASALIDEACGITGNDLMVGKGPTDDVRARFVGAYYHDPELILCAVRWHLRSSLPFREAAARLCARGLQANHTTLWRWVQRYGPELAEPRRPLTPTLSPLTKASQVERDSGFDQQRAALEELTDALEAAVAPSGPARRAPESRD